MSTADELVELEVPFDDWLLEGIDRYRRRSAHGSRSEVVSLALERTTGEP